MPATVSHTARTFPFGEEMAVQHAGGDYATRYKFNGKELDPQTGYYYYGARYYDPVISRWLSVDPLAEKYYGITPYNYTKNNPVIYIDNDGKDAILVVFPDYKVDPEVKIGNWKAPKIPLGHAGVLLIDNKTGLAKYYEFGRYHTDDGTKGRVRSSDTDKALLISNVVIDPKTGKPTQESLNKVLAQISKKVGHGGRIEGAYIEGDFKKMNEYAQEKVKESNDQYKEYDKNREPYSLYTNNCATFAIDVIKQDPDVKKKAPIIFLPTPVNVAEEFRKVFPKVDYDPKTNKTTSDIYEENQ